jgi:hypothetical protein
VRRAATLAAWAVLVALTACSEGQEDAAAGGATVPTAAATTTTIDPYAVPAVIDVAYVNKILAVFEAVSGDAFRLYLRDRRITPEISDRIRALYGTGERYELEIRILEDEKETRLAAEPGNRISTVARLITAAPTCIFAEVVRDYRPVGGKNSNSVAWIGLRPPAVFNDPARHNPTPWRYVVDGAMPDRSQPPNPCAGS